MKSPVLAAIVLSAAWSPAHASERRFTYTYESNVLAPGERELEPWTTSRSGREGYYQRFDERLEFEVGLTERLQTAWYINFTGTTQGPQRQSTFEFKGVSSEWKYKLSDAVADALGSALYFEATAAPAELELEAKLILDKRVGDLLFALNLVGEHEWEFEPGETETEIILEADAGAAYLLAPSVSIGVELRSHNEFHEGELEHSALFGGPAFSYATQAWWAAVSVTPQLSALSGANHRGLDLEEHERVEARLIFGWHL